MSEKFLLEWVEFQDPFSKERKYINLKTGECTLEPPLNVQIHKTDSSNQWWQLYDSKTQRFYYYNINKQKTVWNRPENSEIISFLNQINENNKENERFLIKNNEIKKSLEIDEQQQQQETSFNLKKSHSINLNNNKKSDLNLIINPVFDNKMQPTTPSSSNLDSISLSSSYDTNSLKQSINRRKLPRTNPNYVNVDLITKDGSIKSTYKRFDKNSSLTSINGFVNPLNNIQQDSPSSKLDNSMTSALFFSLNNSKTTNCTNCDQSTCICTSGYSFLTSSPLKPSSISTSLHSPNIKTLIDDTNEFNSSSNTLCNYPYIDESFTTKLRQQQQQHRSPTIKIKALNNTISYPSLNRSHVTNQSLESHSHELLRPNSVFLSNNTKTQQIPTPDNTCAKSIISLQRTLTQPRSPNSYMCNISTSSTTSLNTFNLKQQNYNEKPQQSSLEQFDLNTHKKGSLFFSKKISTSDLMAWSKDPIQKPLIKTNDKTVKKEAPELFKLIQIYMGDRRGGGGVKNNSDLKAICLEIMIKGWSMSVLRDELFFQLLKQTNLNTNITSLKNGWELIAICLSFFPPSQKLYPYFYEYIQRFTDESYDRIDFEISKYSNACMRRLERIHSTGAKKGLKKPTLDEIELSKNTITCVSLFGTTLSEIMAIQNVKCPKLCLPWIQTTLSEAVLKLNGAKTEGIFRVPGDLDEVNNLKVKYDKIWCSEFFKEENFNKIDLLENVEDAHLPASLLKLWYRELYEPLIPNEYYNECIKYCDNPQECIRIIDKLPDINKYVFTYLIRFLKVFAANDNVMATKMDTNNLSMIMAPNCLRCESEDAKTIMENTKKEMLFLKTLILNLDTSIVQGIV